MKDSETILWVEETQDCCLRLKPTCRREGIFGNERKLIIPAVKKHGKKGIHCDGPVSADTVFYKALRGAYDVVVAIYRDQVQSL